MSIRKRDVFWLSTGALFVLAGLLVSWSQWVAAGAVLFAALAVGYSAAGTGSSGSSPVWMIPPSQFPDVEDETPVDALDADGFRPIYEQPEPEEVNAE